MLPGRALHLPFTSCTVAMYVILVSCALTCKVYVFYYHTGCELDLQTSNRVTHVSAMKDTAPVVRRSVILYKCRYCWMPFLRRGQVLSHLRGHVTGGPRECVPCQRVFRFFAVYQLHRRIFHCEKEPFVCETGDLRSAFHTMLGQHFKWRKTSRVALPRKMQTVDARGWKLRINGSAEKNPVKSPKCAIRIAAKCRSTATARVAYKSKEEEVELADLVKIGRTRARTYSCPCCSKTFPNLPRLTEHIATHDDCRPHKCLKCHKQYKNNAHLEEHIRTVHQGEQPHKCLECDRTFTRRSHLVAHNVTHSGERRFECGVCQRRFAHRFQLTAHSHMHSDERRHRCSYCQKLFLRSSDLTRHTLDHMGLGRRRRPVTDGGEDSLAKLSSNQSTPPAKSLKSSRVKTEVYWNCFFCDNFQESTQDSFIYPVILHNIILSVRCCTAPL